ncbi:DUF4023 family protein [Paenibacillus sp. OV219]|nr:DUF4023 family protein [Paenibacillus sp. OV219]SEN55225.1 Protein of unknown function [Paenibacillus sp. OV219]
MDQTSDFVNKLNDTQSKAEHNKKAKAPAKQLQNKQHSTNK